MWIGLRIISLPASFLLFCYLAISLAQAFGVEVFGDVAFSRTILPTSLPEFVKVSALLLAAVGYLAIGQFASRRVVTGVGCTVLAGFLFAYDAAATGRATLQSTDWVEIEWLVYYVLALLGSVFAAFSLWQLSKSRLDLLWGPALKTAQAFSQIERVRRQTYRAFDYRRLPWIAVPFIAAPILYLGKNALGAYLLINVVGWPPNVLSSMQGMVEFAKNNPGKLEIGLLVDGVLTVLLVVVVVFLWRLAWRRVRRTANEVIADANYRPIVYLRSFREEDTVVRPKGLLRLLVGWRPRLEEVLVATVARLGPTVAVGLPGEKIPKLGALRAYYEDKDWQAAVLGWLDRSFLVVLLAGSSRWILWELNQILAHGHSTKLLLVIPHDDTAHQRQERWNQLCESMANSNWIGSLRHMDPARLLGVLFRPDGTVVGVTGRGHDQVDLEIMVRLAVVALVEPAAAHKFGQSSSDN
jgi:hypothetical protein